MCTPIYEDAKHNKSIHHHDSFYKRHVNFWTRADCSWVVDLGWNWHTGLTLPLNHGSFTAEDDLGVVRTVKQAEDGHEWRSFTQRKDVISNQLIIFRISTNNNMKRQFNTNFRNPIGLHTPYSLLQLFDLQYKKYQNCNNNRIDIFCELTDMNVSLVNPRIYNKFWNWDQNTKHRPGLISFFQNVQTAPGVHAASYSMENVCACRRGKAAV
jgi:hypothetical protein